MHISQSLDVKVGELGVAVRRIKDWHDVKIEDLLEFCEDRENHKVTAHGKVEVVESYNFRNIPARLLEHEQILVVGYRRID